MTFNNCGALRAWPGPTRLSVQASFDYYLDLIIAVRSGGACIFCKEVVIYDAASLLQTMPPECRRGKIRLIVSCRNLNLTMLVVTITHC